MRDSLAVEVWSDIACPWCRIGRAHLELALARFEHADAVVVTWRSFELDPGTPAIAEQTLTERLAAKYRTDAAGVARMQQNVADRGAAAGLRFDFDTAHPDSTFDAHRLAHLAGERGVQDAIVGALFTAYHEGGAHLGDHEVLTQIGVDAGLDAAEATDVLASDAYADAVRADEATAGRLGISGVPFFVLDGRYGVSGAQPPDAILAALRQAWAG